MLLTFSVFTALIIDLFVGDPRRWHPLVGFGNMANWLENKLNGTHNKSPFWTKLKGMIAWSLLVLPIVILLWWIEQKILSTQSNFILGFICLTFAIGAKSLMQHAKAVANALKESDLILARKRVAMIVSRDTSGSDEEAINKATIESVLENGSDAIFAAIFWFVVLGAPGVVLYRLVNTLDAMWGYRTKRFNSFGWAAARIDDCLNWLPARLTGLSYMLAGDIGSAFLCWKKQAKFWHGINPGVVMASGAGALKVKLGGSATYHGRTIKRPELGCDNTPGVADIKRSIQLVNTSIIIWLIIIAVGDYFIVGI